jgi:hypothetical protein
MTREPGKETNESNKGIAQGQDEGNPEECGQPNEGIREKRRRGEIGADGDGRR